MNPTDFPEANGVATAPPTMNNCVDLPVFRDMQHAVSCWRPTAEEIAMLVAGSPVYLGVLAGGRMPPVWVEVHNPFLVPLDDHKAAMIMGLAPHCQACRHFIGDAAAGQCTHFQLATVWHHCCPHYQAHV